MGPIRTWRGAVPKEFVCPIAGKFMSDPVVLPAGRGTCDRSSITATWLADDAQPNLVLRTKICAWISQHITRRFEYRLDPPFAFISTESHLRAAFESLKQFASVDEALPSLIRLSNAVHRLDPAVLQRAGFRAVQCVGDLRRARSSRHVGKIAVSMLADACEIEIKGNVSDNYAEFQLENIATRIYTCGISTFQAGFVNLMHTLALANEAELSARVGETHGIIQTLVSYVWPIPYSLASEGMYQKVLDTLYNLTAVGGNSWRIARAGAVAQVFNLFRWPARLDSEHEYALDVVLGARGRIAAMEAGMKILLRLCRNTEVGCAGVVGLARGMQMHCFCDALFNYVESAEAMAAGLGVLVDVMQYCELGPILSIAERELLMWQPGPRGVARYIGTEVVPAALACFQEFGRIRVKQMRRPTADLDR